MKSLDFSKWAIIAPNNDTGLGRMAQDMKAILPIGRHLVTKSSLVPDRPMSVPRDISLSGDCSQSQLEAMLDGLQGFVFFERHSWHPKLLQTARKMRITSVCVPMWEWFRGRSPSWRNVDYFACPNSVCLKVVQSYGYKNAERIDWTLDLARLPHRKVSGPARHFVHNAGLIDADDRKGTRETIEAFARCDDPTLRLTVRVQQGIPHRSDDVRIEYCVGNLKEPGALYATGDVFVQPSKLEGMGFMVLEAVAAGVPVISLDAAPMNEWSRHPDLLARVRRLGYPAYSSAWIEHSHLRLPNVSDLTDRIVWASRNDLGPIGVRNRDWAASVFDPSRLVQSWEGLLYRALRVPLTSEFNSDPEPRFPCHSIAYRMRSYLAASTGWRLPLFRRT